MRKSGHIAWLAHIPEFQRRSCKFSGIEFEKVILQKTARFENNLYNFSENQLHLL